MTASVNKIAEERADRAARVAGGASDVDRGGKRPDEAFVRAISMAVEELVARFVALREAERNARAEAAEIEQAVRAAQAGRRRLCFSGWVFDLHERRLVAPGGGVVPLPGLEFTLLRAFADHPRKVLSRADLVQLTRREGTDFPSARSISVYVSRLRGRLRRSGGAPLITTVWRTGYVFDTDVVRL
jgi:two-component system OmpR family response regulator